MLAGRLMAPDSGTRGNSFWLLDFYACGSETVCVPRCGAASFACGSETVCVRPCSASSPSSGCCSSTGMAFHRSGRSGADAWRATGHGGAPMGARAEEEAARSPCRMWGACRSKPFPANRAAMTGRARPFRPKGPRDCSRVLANHSERGGHNADGTMQTRAVPDDALF